jgi:orotate phosphoribosyltransferase
MVVSYSLELGMDTPRTRRILDLAEKTGALLHGEFKLSSGQVSDHYFDGKMLTLNPEGAYLIGKEIFDILVRINVDTIGGLVLGAVPIVSSVALVSHLERKPIRSFIVREMPKNHGTMKLIEGHFEEGSKVAIVDDVITKGGSIRKAIEAVEAAKGEVVKVIVIVDRHEGGSDELKRKGYDVEAIIHLPPLGDASVGDYSVTAEGFKARV